MYEVLNVELVHVIADTSFVRIESASSCRLLVTSSHSGATFFVLSVHCRRSSLIRFPLLQRLPFIRLRAAPAVARAKDIGQPRRRATRPSNATSAVVLAA